MTLGGGAGQSLVMAAAKELQLRGANIDRPVTFSVTGATLSGTNAAGGADDLVSQDVIQSAATSTLSVRSYTNSSLVISGNMLGAAGAGIIRSGGYVVFRGAANTLGGTLTLGVTANNISAGITRIQPAFSGNLSNPFQGANAVSFLQNKIGRAHV